MNQITTVINFPFFRIVGKGVHGREEYFTENPVMVGKI